MAVDAAVVPPSRKAIFSNLQKFRNESPFFFFLNQEICIKTVSSPFGTYFMYIFMTKTAKTGKTPERLGAAICTIFYKPGVRTSDLIQD